MTDDETVELGMFCEHLFGSHNFTTLLEQFEQQIVQHMLNTEPHEAKKREGIYASFLGLRDFLGNMRAIIDEKRKLTEPQNAVSETDPQVFDEG